MASKANHNVLAMTMILVLVFMTTIDFTVAQVGVCNGRLGSSLPSAPQVVALYNRNSIRRMRIYDPDQATLQALAGSGIEVMLGVPNTDLTSIAASQANANAWVQTNVRNHPNVQFRYIAVGNEVSPLRESRQYVGVLLVAMSNIYNAIQSAGYGNRIRVSTAIDFGLLGNSYPPADGAFRSDVTSFIDPIIRFLVNTGQPICANIYPYFSYTGAANGQIDLGYALFTSNGITVPDGTRYQNLFYAMVDAMYAAVGRRGGSSLEVVVSETGWPSAGASAATLANARTYNTNLVQRVKNGTPRRPGAIETYIFAMFDENQKTGPDIERNFGLFSPNMIPKYSISFN